MVHGACCMGGLQELSDALRLLSSRASEEQAATASDRRRMEGVVKSLEGRLAQVGLGLGLRLCVGGWSGLGLGTRLRQSGKDKECEYEGGAGLGLRSSTGMDWLMH